MQRGIMNIYMADLLIDDLHRTEFANGFYLADVLSVE